MILVPVGYHKKAYPKPIVPHVMEVAGHFDAKVPPSGALCLHTEYSFGKRGMDSPYLFGLDEIKGATKSGIPQLWKSDKWAEELAVFVQEICGDYVPTAVEIHPPFTDYASSISAFTDRCSVFLQAIHDVWPTTLVLLENRYGTRYKGGSFLISTFRDLIAFGEHIQHSRIPVGIALDIPQLLSTVGGPDRLSEKALRDLLHSLDSQQRVVRSVHLWGKRVGKNGRPVAHCGDLNSYFSDDARKKQVLLDWLADFLSDGAPRFFVPEVNSCSSDLHSIVEDLLSVGIRFDPAAKVTGWA